MLYIGHFSFDALTPDQEVRHGYFTCLAQAQTEDQVLLVFKEYLLGLQQSQELFSGVRAVYIEDIIRVAEPPQRPVITRWQFSQGQFPKSISHSLPFSATPGIVSYEWKPDRIAAEDAQPSDDGYQVSKAFITFTS